MNVQNMNERMIKLHPLIKLGTTTIQTVCHPACAILTSTPLHSPFSFAFSQLRRAKRVAKEEVFIALGIVVKSAAAML